MAIPPPNTYSTADVIDRTGISRYTLQRFLRMGKFPAPINKSKGSGSPNYFPIQEVDEWIEAQKSHLPATSVEPLNGEYQVTITFTKREMSQHRRACAELQCEFEAYARDAVNWKTSAILPDSQQVRTSKLRLVS